MHATASVTGRRQVLIALHHTDWISHTAEDFCDCKVTLEYCVEWEKRHMPSTHASKQKNRNKDTAMCVRPDVQRRGERVPDKGTTTMLDAIDEETTALVVDAGVADQESTASSKLRCPSERSFDDDRTVAGPSFPDMMQKGPLLGHLGMCAACRKLYQTAKKKRPLKNKLLDNDPTSLTCDQWVMLKRTRRRGHGMKLTPWDHHVIERVRERFEWPTDEGDQRTASTSHCPRSHNFLQRNLKRCRVVERARKTVRKGRRKQAANDWSLTQQPRVDDSGTSVHGDPVPHGRSSTERKSRIKHVARDGSSNKPQVVDSGLHSDTSLHGDPVPHRGASRTGRKSRRTQSGSAQDGPLSKQPLLDSGLHSDTSFCSDPVPQSRSGTTRKSRKKQQSAKDRSASKPRVGDSGVHSDASVHSDPSFHGDPVHTTGSRTAKKGKKHKSGAAQNLAKQPRVDDSGLHSDASVLGDPVHTTGSRTAKKGKKNKSGAAQDLTKQPCVDDSGLHSDASFRGDLARSPHQPHVDDSGLHSDASFGGDLARSPHQPHVDDCDLHCDPVHTTGSRTAKKGKKRKSGAAQDLTKQPRVDDSGLHSDASFRGDPVPHSPTTHRGSSTERRRQSAKDGTLAKQPCLDPLAIGSQPECSETESSTSGEFLCFELIPASVTYAGPVPVALRSPPKRRAGERFKELFDKALCKRSTIERLDCM